MTHTPEFDRWLNEQERGMVRLAQYSDQIPAQPRAITEAPLTHDDPECAAHRCSAMLPFDAPRFAPCFCKCHLQPDSWIDQNHRNMVATNTAETLSRMSALERDHYNAQPLTRDQQRMFNAIVMLGCVICVALAVWAAVWIGGKL